MRSLLLAAASVALILLMLFVGMPLSGEGTAAREKAFRIGRENARRAATLAQAEEFHRAVGEYLGAAAPAEPGLERLFPSPPVEWSEALALFPPANVVWEAPAEAGGVHRLQVHGSFRDLAQLLGAIDGAPVPLALEEMEMMRVGSRLTLVLLLRPAEGETP